LDVRGRERAESTAGEQKIVPGPNESENLGEPYSVLVVILGERADRGPKSGSSKKKILPFHLGSRISVQCPP
jgi:hypothetical protein